MLSTPYTCEWARSLYRFAVAHVPIWIFWGRQFKNTTVAYSPMEYFLPPDDVVARAMDRSRKSGNLILPSYHFDIMAPPPLQEHIYTHSNDSPDPTLPDSQPNLGQSPSSTLNSLMDPSSPDMEPTWTAIDASAPPPLPESSNTDANSAKALAALEDFFAKRREVLEQRISNEEPVEKTATA